MAQLAPDLPPALAACNETGLFNLWFALAGHRMQLLQHHTHVLACEGNAAWRMYTAEEYGRVLRSRGTSP